MAVLDHVLFGVLWRPVGRTARGRIIEHLCQISASLAPFLQDFIVAEISMSSDSGNDVRISDRQRICLPMTWEPCVRACVRACLRAWTIFE